MFVAIIELVIAIVVIKVFISVFKDASKEKDHLPDYPNRFTSKEDIIAWNIKHPEDPCLVSEN